MTDADLTRRADLDDLLISCLRTEVAAANAVVDALECIQRLTAERDALAAQLDALRARIEGLADEYDDAIPGFVRRLRAALAARSAPTVNAGPLRVEYGLAWDDLGSADTFPTLEQARAAARGLDEPPQVVRIETWPVADEGREDA